MEYYSNFTITFKHTDKLSLQSMINSLYRLSGYNKDSWVEFERQLDGQQFTHTIETLRPITFYDCDDVFKKVSNKGTVIVERAGARRDDVTKACYKNGNMKLIHVLPQKYSDSDLQDLASFENS